MHNLEKAIKGLEEFIRDIKPFYGNQEDWKKIYDALDLLKEQDNCENCAIGIEDRQPVVRCKDCKYWRQLYGDRPFYSSIGCCDCDDMWRSLDGETTEVNDVKTDSDFYCGYADRR